MGGGLGGVQSGQRAVRVLQRKRGRDQAVFESAECRTRVKKGGGGGGGDQTPFFSKIAKLHPEDVYEK